MSRDDICPNCRESDPNTHSHLHAVYQSSGQYHCPTCHAWYYRERGRWVRLY